MWAKTILNVENIVQMSDFIPDVGVISTVGKICYTAFYWEIRYAEQGSKAVHKKVHLVKVRGKGCSILFFFKSKVSSYYVIKGYDNTVPAGQAHKHNIKPVNSDFMILFYLCLRKCDFELPHFDTVAYGRHSLHYQGPFIWSKVSSELRNLTSLKAFRKHIRGVNLLSHVDNNSNCCDLCKFWVVYICI